MADEAKARVRLTDIAERAGVTESVVSRVLNSDPTLCTREVTRKRVLAVASALGYQARVPVRAVALLIPELDNPVFSRIIRGACRRAAEREYVVLLGEDEPEMEAGESFAELVDSGRVDGLLVASAHAEHPLLTGGALAHLPHVFVDREVSGSGRNVIVDQGAASEVAAEHLVALGHERIGHVAGPSGTVTSRAREQAFRDALERFGLGAELIAREEFGESGGAAAAEALLERAPELTALYTSSLTQAVGALHALRSRGRRVPEDVSLVTYDDLPFAAYLDPPLTGIAMPLQELGATAVDALLDQLDGHPPRDVLVPGKPRLVERSSTAPL